jgi:two-component system cell cycle sensor histidine kinase/response regulator CckA
MLCKFSIPDDLWLVNIDRGQIGKVIQNLILNASQAMPAGGVVHEGNISAQPEPGEGTTFTICPPAASGKPEKKGYEENKDYQPHQAKILVMDGDVFVRDVTRQMLKHLGHTVTCAKNGTETVQFYEDSANSDQPFDLVIMDLTVPGAMGGKEAARKILAINPEAKIIVSGDYSHDPVIANRSVSGFCAAIAKPYLLEELEEVVNGALRQRHQ